MSLLDTVLLKLKLKDKPHITSHDRAKEMERPVPPPVSGAYGNTVRTTPSRRDTTGR